MLELKKMFSAFDTEFTGVQAGDHHYNSLFDSPAERYSKLRDVAQTFIPCQFGNAPTLKLSNLRKIFNFQSESNT